MTTMTAEKFQPLVCKKCGESNLYHPTEDVGNWPRVKFDQVQAFETDFDVPHWYICPVNPQGKHHRDKLMSQMGELQKKRIHEKDMVRIERTPVTPPGQTKLPSEKLTPLDRDIAAKLVVMEMCLEDIKRLLAQKAQSNI